MQMDMLRQRLSPGVEDGCEANFTAQTFLSERFQRLRGTGKKQVVYLFLVNPRQGIEQMVNGKDDVEVVGGQQMRFLLFQPLQFG